MDSLARILLVSSTFLLYMAHGPASALAAQCPGAEDGATAAERVRRFLDLASTREARRKPLHTATCADDVAALVDAEINSGGAPPPRYSRFLDEAADSLHRAAESVRRDNVGDGAAQLESEIRLRKLYLASCAPVPDTCRRLEYNLVSLLQAHQYLKKGDALNDWMIEAGVTCVARSSDAVDLWLRALYSCPKWDMTVPLTASASYDGANLCSEDCKDQIVAAAKAMTTLRFPPSAVAKARRFLREADCSARSQGGAASPS
jgi:hypothetical protein